MLQTEAYDTVQNDFVLLVVSFIIGTALYAFICSRYLESSLTVLLTRVAGSGEIVTLFSTYNKFGALREKKS